MPSAVRTSNLFLYSFATGATLYATALLAVWKFADKLMFPGPRGGEGGEDFLTITDDAGTAISAIYLPHPKARYTVLFSHGNGDDLGDVLPFLRELRGRGFAAMSYDYPGYGRSGGRPTGAGAIEAARAAYDWLVRQKGVRPERIILHGFSIGGGPASILATENVCAGLVLEGSFTAATRVMTKIAIFPFERFDNRRRILRLPVPLLVIHGEKDRVVPFRHGEELYRIAATPKIFLAVEHGGHTNLHREAGERYWQAWQDFTRLIEGAPTGAARG